MVNIMFNKESIQYSTIWNNYNVMVTDVIFKETMTSNMFRPRSIGMAKSIRPPQYGSLVLEN